MSENLYLQFERSFRAAGDKTAIGSADGSLQLSYAELLSSVARYANGSFTLDF